MARLEARAFVEKLATDLEDRKNGYLHDLSNRLEKTPDKLTGKAAHGLNGRYRECDEILDLVKAGLGRLA